MGNTTSVMVLKNSQYLTTIPKAIAEAMRLKKSIKLQWILDRGDIIIRKVE